MILVHSGSTLANFFNKTSAKSKYFAKIVILLAINQAIWAFWAGRIIIFNINEATQTIKTSTCLSNTALINSFLLMNFIFQVVGRVFLVV